CACLPAWVFGRPRLLRSSVSFFVSLFAWSSAFFSESFVTPFVLTEETIEVIEVLHVFTAEQRSPAHFSVGVVSLLLPPQPAATMASASTTAAKTDFNSQTETGAGSPSGAGTWTPRKNTKASTAPTAAIATSAANAQW